MPELAPEVAAIRERFALFGSRLNERQIREFAGVEAKVFGRGGARAVVRATGLAMNTVRRGLAELKQPAVINSSVRVRQPGGGRKKLREKDPTLVAALEALVEPFSCGDPMHPLRRTCKSVRRLANELQAQHHAISPAKVAELLSELGYSL